MVNAKRLGMVGPNKKNLPEEVVIEILSWLPTKSLMQLRCVSPKWFQLLTQDPIFAKLHIDRLTQITNLDPNPSILASPCDDFKNLYLAFDYTACDNVSVLELPFHQGGESEGYTICGICDGLLCLYLNNNKEVHIWNPLIKDYATISCLPTPPIRFPTLMRKFSAFGFGFDIATNKYKVVRAFNECDLDGRMCRTQLSVYTLGLDLSWRVLEQDIQCFLTPASNIPFVNGSLHWITRKPGMMSDNLILAFDFKDEVFKEIPYPTDINPACNTEIVELGGLLGIFSGQGALDVEIWTMKEYGVVGSWTKQFIIETSQDWGDSSFLEIVGFAKNEEIIVNKNLGELILYNPKTKSCRHLGKFKFPMFPAYTYIGSIVSPSFISGAGKFDRNSAKGEL